MKISRFALLAVAGLLVSATIAPVKADALASEPESVARGWRGWGGAETSTQTQTPTQTQTQTYTPSTGRKSRWHH